MTVRVAPLAPGSERDWDAFVLECPEATFFHVSGWRDVIEKAFGHRTFYLAASTKGRLSGVLPLTLIRSRIFGCTLISNAFSVFGGPVASDPQSRQALENAAVEMAERLNVDCVEFRSQSPSAAWVARHELYANFSRPIYPDLDANLNAIPRKQRAMVRKGISNGLVAEAGDIKTLHHIYAQSVRNLGTPVFPRRYFGLLKERFGDACENLVVFQRARPVAAVMSFHFRDQVLPFYGGGTSEARLLAANDFMYWEVMRRAHQRGARVFDFGRSKIGTGAYHFKKNWGFSPLPLSYSFLPIRQERIPEINPLNPKYAKAIALWKKLPLPVTKIIGPMIVRQIG